MGINEMLIGVFIGVLGSYIATALYNMNSSRKKKKIEQQIANLDHEENFLERISKGNIELIRSCFRALFFAIGIAFVSLGGILFSIAVNPPEVFQFYVMVIGSGLLVTAGAVVLSQANALVKLKNLNKAKEVIEEKRKKLKSKL